MPGILVHVLESITKIEKLVNTWKNVNAWKVLWLHSLEATCDQIKDTPQSVVVSSSNGIHYSIIAVVLFSIACLLLLLVIVVKYVKCGLTILCLLWYYHNDWNSSEAMVFSRRKQKVFYQQQYWGAIRHALVRDLDELQINEKVFEQLLEKESCEAATATERIFLDLMETSSNLWSVD